MSTITVTTEWNLRAGAGTVTPITIWCVRHENESWLRLLSDYIGRGDVSSSDKGYILTWRDYREPSNRLLSETYNQIVDQITKLDRDLETFSKFLAITKELLSD